MTGVALNTQAIFDRLTSHAQTLALFERVNGHQTKNSPGVGLSADFWVDTIDPLGSSGLAATSARTVFMARIYLNMLTEPQDSIDPTVVDATDKLFEAYAGDFDLGGNVRCIDLLGQSGLRLSAKTGYAVIGDATYRCMTITIPVLINDAWPQAA